MKLHRLPCWLMALPALLLTGCQTLQAPPEQPVSIQPEPTQQQGELPLNAQQRIAKDLISAMLDAPNVVHLTAKTRPILLIDRLVNRTSDHIDTDTFTQAIYAQLQHNKQFRLLDVEQVQALSQRLDYLSHNGLIDPAKAIEFGRQAGAEYMLYGQLTGDKPYQITLRLIDLESGLIEWAYRKNSVLQ